MHQPVVPLHLHKGVGWLREENPCISNHLMQPMTTTSCLQPFLQSSPPSLADSRSKLERPQLLKPRLTSGSIPARIPISADPSKLPPSQGSLKQSDDSYWALHPCLGQPGVPSHQCSLTDALSYHTLGLTGSPSVSPFKDTTPITAQFPSPPWASKCLPPALPCGS